jgi:hypothetical protein
LSYHYLGLEFPILGELFFCVGVNMAYNGTKTIEYPSFLLRRYVKFSILVGDMSLKEVAMAFMKVKRGSLEGFCHLMGNSDETAIYAHFF